MTSNIYNPSTGQTGFQVPGASTPSGWVAGNPPDAATVPTTAPSAQNSNNSSSTAVFSGNAASDFTNGKIIPTMNQAQTDVNNQNALNTAKTAADKLQSDINTYKAGQNTTTQKSPEQQVLSTPDTGNKFVYDSTGVEHQIGINEPLPNGYSSANPASRTDIGGTAETTNGTTIKQFSDGTFGSYGPTGQYQGPASSQDFQSAQTSADLQKRIQQVINGTYPLSPTQQAQITGIQSQYQDLIEQQQTANANFTGGTTVESFINGTAGTSIGLGTVQTAVNDGLKKIADLQNKLASNVASMTAAFQKDNLTDLKDAYDEYKDSDNQRQAEIDKIQSAITAKQESDRQYQLAVEEKQYNEVTKPIQDLAAEVAKFGAPEAVQQAVAGAKTYADAIQAAAGYANDPTSPAGEYSAYLKQTQASGKTAMTAGDFLAAQKYKESYATASASQAAQAAYTDSDKNQASLEKSFRASLLSSRSDLGVQNKKVSQAIDLQTLVNGYKDKDGNYNIPASQYGELVLGLAGLLSPTGTPSEGTRDSITQATAKGDIAGAVGYLTGTTPNGTTQDVVKNLVATIQRQGQTAEQLRNQQISAQVPTGLKQDRIDRITGALPSYENMNTGDPAYQTPEQINATATDKLNSFHDANPKNASILDEIHTQFPGLSAVEVAQKLNLIPSPTQ